MSRPLTPKTPLPSYWTKEHVGLIRYDRYWQHYSLILDVEINGKGFWVTELDCFGGVNHTHEHKLRRHCTAIDMGDLFWTVEEFAQIVKHYQDKQSEARDTP